MKFIILKSILKLISVYTDKIQKKKQERKYTKADKICGLLGVFKDNSKGIDTMGCLSTVIGIFIVMGALAAFGAVFFALPLIGAVILYFRFSKYIEIPKWWKALTIVMVAASTVLFADDVFDETIHTGHAPFLLLGMYGVLSAIFFAVKRKTSGSTFFPSINADEEDTDVFSQEYDETIVTDSDENENDDDLLDEEVKTKALCERLKQILKWIQLFGKRCIWISNAI